MNILHSQCQLLVSTFVENPNWAKEIKIAKKLLASYSLDLLLSVDVKNLASLSFFLCEDGKEAILRAERISKLSFS